MTTVKAPARTKKLTALFSDSDAAERAFQACVDLGYEAGQINVVISEATRKRLLAEHDETKSNLTERKAEGGELGGPSGGRVGILVTIIAAVGAAVAIPTIGFIVGPVAVALTAAGAAGAAAGLIGALANWGIPAERIREYESGIQKGAILIMLETTSESDAHEIETAWKKLGGRDIHYG